MISLKEISELKEKLIVDRARWMRLDTTKEQLLHDLMDIVVGLAEHLEVAEKSETPCIRTDGSCLLPCRVADEVARKAIVSALRWVRPHAPFADMSIHEYVSGIDDAITRVENGGEL